MMEDPFASAFASMAEERRKVTLDNAMAQIRAAYEDLESEDGGIPDIVVVMGNASTVCTVGNGITDERALWLLNSVIHDMFCGGA